MTVRFFNSTFCCLLVAITSQATFASEVDVVEHVSKADPPRSTTLIQSDFNSIAFKFPDNTVSWQVNFSVERDLPDIGFSISGKADSPATITANKKLQAIIPSLCPKAGLPKNCTTKPSKFGEFNLEPGDSLIAEVHFQIIVDAGEGKTKHEEIEKTYQYKMRSIGTLRFGVGTFFIFSGADDYFTSTADGVHMINSKSGDNLTLNLAATATWIPHKYSSIKGIQGGWALGPTVAVGTNSDNLSVFAGVSAIYRRAWTITAGIAAAKENTLVSQYEVGQVIPEPIDSSALTKESYKARFFVGLSWSPPTKK